MERGELIVTTESPETARKIKISAMVGSIALAALLIWSNVGSNPQTLVFSVIIGAMVALIGILNFIRPESYGSMYENAFVGRAAMETGSRTVPFELPYEAITEIRRFKKRGQEKYLLICTADSSYKIFCRIHQQELTSALLERITPTAEPEAEA